MSTEQSRRTGAPRGNRNARKHGHAARKLVLRDVRLTDISRQNAVGRLVADKAEAIMADCGGRESLSELQQDLVSRYVTTELLIQSIDHWLLQQPSIINKRKKTAIPILLDRNRLSETSLKIATALGLERRPPAPKTLAQYMAEREQNGAAKETTPEGVAASPAQPDAQEPAPEPQPRDGVNGRFLEKLDDGEQPEGAHGD